ncbi:MAG: hypothetical protein Q8N68_03130, partial [bacterium]|nr:hypothetical protein [bacterium]
PRLSLLLPLGLDIIIPKLEAKLWLLDVGPREEFGANVLSALKGNQEKIGGLAIAEWLAMYEHQFSQISEPSDLEIKQFFDQNEKIGSLNDQEKTNLNIIFTLYNFLYPFSVWNQYIKDLLAGKVEDDREQKQARLGQAIAKNMPAQVYRGTQDIRDTRPQNMRTISRVAQSAPVVEPVRPQNMAPPPVIPAIPLNKNFVQRPMEVKSQNIPPEITIAMLEAAGEKDDSIEEERLRKIIKQDFNKLSEEVRRYVVNSPFWAE